MKKILLIATGGTIASGNTPSGLTPTISGEELLKSVPGLKNICEPHAIQVLNLDFHIESTADRNPGDHNVYTNIYTLHLPAKLNYTDVINYLSSYTNIQVVRVTDT